MESTKLQTKYLSLCKMYLTRIYIPSNTRLELWRCLRLVGLSVLIKLRDGEARERRSNIYKRPLGGSCRISAYPRRQSARPRLVPKGSRCERAGGRGPGPLQPRTPPRNLIGPNGASTSIINRVQNINDTVTVFQKLN